MKPIIKFIIYRLLISIYHKVLHLLRFEKRLISSQLHARYRESNPLRLPFTIGDKKGRQRIGVAKQRRSCWSDVGCEEVDAPAPTLNVSAARPTCLFYLPYNCTYVILYCWCYEYLNLYTGECKYNDFIVLPSKISKHTWRILQTFIGFTIWQLFCIANSSF